MPQVSRAALNAGVGRWAGRPSEADGWKVYITHIIGLWMGAKRAGRFGVFPGLVGRGGLLGVAMLVGCARGSGAPDASLVRAEGTPATDAARAPAAAVEPRDAGPPGRVWLVRDGGSDPLSGPPGQAIRTPVTLRAYFPRVPARSLSARAAQEASSAPVPLEFQAADVDGGAVVSVVIPETAPAGLVNVVWEDDAGTTLVRSAVLLEAPPAPDAGTSTKSRKTKKKRRK